MKREKRILLSSPHMSDEGFEMEYVKEAFDTNWIAPLGKNVDGFENDVIEMVGSKGALALSSGTAAIHLALKLLDVKEDDIVLCQTLTFSATANPIIYEKATPVFIDSELDTWNMCPVALEEALIKYPQTKAVMVVHLYGISANLEKIVEICKKYDVKLIEDAAESLGTIHKGQYTGTFGDFGIFSFNGNKIITTSGGGMLVSNDEQALQKAKFWSTQSREPELHYEHKEIGYNYRLSNVSAGIGRGQLKVLEDRVDKKRFIYNYYKEHLGDLSGISFMPDPVEDRSNCWLTAITIETDKITPVELIKRLDEANVEARPLWKPMHLQPVFSQYDYVGNNIAEDLFNKGVCLPSDSKMTIEELEYVVKTIRDFWL